MAIQENLRYLDVYLDGSNPTNAQNALANAFNGEQGEYPIVSGEPLGQERNVSFNSPEFRVAVCKTFDAQISACIGNIRGDSEFINSSLKNRGLRGLLNRVDMGSFAIAKQASDISDVKWAQGFRGNLSRNYSEVRQYYVLFKTNWDEATKSNPQ